jgi:hypothetical protein
MKVRELLEMVDRLHPNQFSINDKLLWLNEVEQMIWMEIITTHEGVEEDAEMPAYTASDMEVGVDTELLAADPYSRLYEPWIVMQIAGHNHEMMQHDAASMAFQTAYGDYFNWYNRHHMPVGAVNHLHLLDRTWGVS